MKLNVAVAGLGNLGKSLISEIAKDTRFDLVAAFSRRQADVGARAPVLPFERAAEVAKGTDVLLLALGSYNDITQNLHCFSAFHTVDSYDVHAKMQNYKDTANKTKPNKISLCGVGWDPGTLSMLRGLFGAVGNVATFWGKGISQGHSNAVRQIAGVIDAVEVTIPQESAKSHFLQGDDVPENSRHKRVCYVACADCDQLRVAREIINMPHYFLGQKTVIEFVSLEKVAQIKQNTAHRGQVVARGCGFTAQTSLDVECNTQFTAKVMLQYALAVPRLVHDGFLGALDVFDVPLKYVCDKKFI